MTFKMISASLALAVAFAGPVMAQDASPVCNNTNAAIAHSPSGTPESTNSMADTSSGGASTGTGASSAALGTGPTDKTGVNSPCVAGMGSARGTTGALPNSPPNTP
jgi:hypothetical protein